MLDFTKKCTEKIELAKIRQIKKRVLHQKSAKNGPDYKVMMKNNEEFPACDCAAWKKTMLPCKHVLAVLRSST